MNKPIRISALLCSFFNILWIILLLYSLVSTQLLPAFQYTRYFYLPIFFLEIIAVASCLYFLTQATVGRINLSLNGFLIISFLFYILVQPLLFGVLIDAEFSFVNWLADFVIIAISILFGLSINKMSQSLSMAQIDNILMKGSLCTSLIVTLSVLRYFIFRETGFFNITPPLAYRFFTLVICLNSFYYGLYIYTVKKIRLLMFPPLIAGIAVLASGSRTGIVAFVVSLLYFSFQQIMSAPKSYEFIMKMLSWIAIVLILVLSYFFLDFAFFNSYSYSRVLRVLDIVNIASLNIDASIQANSSIQRTVFAAAAWELFLKNPLFGIGFGGYIINFPSSLYNLAGTLARPHNTFLSLLVSGGLISTSLFFVYFFRLSGFFLPSKGMSSWSNKLTSCLRSAGLASLLLMGGYDLLFSFLPWIYWSFNGAIMLRSRQLLNPES